MVKVEKFIEVTIKLDLEEAVKLRETLSRATSSYPVYDALDTALKMLPK